jgi:hypothetical protein
VSEQLLATFWTDQDDRRVAELATITRQRPLIASEQAEIAASRVRLVVTDIASNF